MFSKDLENAFLDSNKHIDLSKLTKEATTLSKDINYKDFINQFDNTNKAIIKTPIKDLEINPKYAYYHLLKKWKYGKWKGK